MTAEQQAQIESVRGLGASCLRLVKQRDCTNRAWVLREIMDVSGHGGTVNQTIPIESMDSSLGRGDALESKKQLIAWQGNSCN